MKDGRLDGYHLAILVTDGFEEIELVQPKNALEEAGAKISIISPKTDYVQGFRHDEKADRLKVDMSLNEARAENFDALILPGGVRNPDSLRLKPQAISFIKEFGHLDKPIAAICHGLWPLINAELVKGKRLTSWPSLEIDLKNAGAEWVDEEVVVSHNLVTSRKPDDLRAFIREIINLLSKK